MTALEDVIRPVKLTEKGLIPKLSHKNPRLNHSQTPTRLCIAEDAFHRIVRRFFEGAYVQIKLRDGRVIEGKLVKIDSNIKHNGIGNLILENGVLVRGSAIQHITLRKVLPP